MAAFRPLRALMDAIRSTIPRFISIARELALEVVGFVFFAFAAVCIFGPFGLIQSYRDLPDSLARVVVAAVVAAMFTWFGATSFQRAKRLARKR